MRTFAYIATIAVLATALLSGCSEKGPQNDNQANNNKQAQSDIDRLQGTWQMVSSERKGKPEPSFAKMKLVIEGDILKLMEGDEVTYKGTITLDPSANPKTLNMELIIDTAKQKKARSRRGFI